MRPAPVWNSAILKSENGDNTELREMVLQETLAILNPMEEWEGLSTGELLEALYPKKQCGHDFLKGRQRIASILGNFQRGLLAKYASHLTVRPYRFRGKVLTTRVRWHGPAGGCCPTCKRPY